MLFYKCTYMIVQHVWQISWTWSMSAYYQLSCQIISLLSPASMLIIQWEICMKPLYAIVVAMVLLLALLLIEVLFHVYYQWHIEGKSALVCVVWVSPQIHHLGVKFCNVLPWFYVYSLSFFFFIPPPSFFPMLHMQINTPQRKLQCSFLNCSS